MTPAVSMSAPETVVDLDAASTANSNAAPTRRRVPASHSVSDAAPAAASRDAPAPAPARPGAAPSPANDPSLLLAHLDSPQAVHLAEAANLARPVLKYLATPPNHHLVPFDRAWLATLHREMFGDVWAWAGRFRETPIDGATPPSKIEAAIDAMLAARATAIAAATPEIDRVAALFAHASSIRPFLHGNGRWCRLLVDIDLALHRAPTIAWPNDPAARPILRDALDAATRGDRSPLTALLRRWQRA